MGPVQTPGPQHGLGGGEAVTYHSTPSHNFDLVSNISSQLSIVVCCRHEDLDTVVCNSNNSRYLDLSIITVHLQVKIHFVSNSNT